ncbi:MAG: nucleotide exchange factor GrpE [Magnetococcales bacterium]|nr:nucleotide exchange factor GrpE [Magnetococcales bacterium]
MSRKTVDAGEETPRTGQEPDVENNAPEESVTVEDNDALDDATTMEGEEFGEEPEEKSEGYISPMELLIQAQAKAEEYRNDYLRALADMKNLRQRTEREIQQARQFAIEAFAKDLLQVADNLERALSAIPASDDPVSVAVTDGVRMVASGLENTLKKHGVTRIQAMNAPFDPNLHQAVMQVEDPTVEPDRVVRELQSGYLLNQRLLRPSMVGISQGGSRNGNS